MTKPKQTEPAESASDGQVLPHDLEAERALLGSILLRDEGLDVAGQILASTDFFRKAHKTVFSTMLKVRNEEKKSVDFVTLKDALRRSQELEPVGGPAYLSSLVDGLPRSSNVKHYATIIKEKAILRGLIEASQKALDAAFEAKDSPAEILQAADRDLLNLQSGMHVRGLVRSSSTAVFEDLENRVATKGTLTGLETGFKSLNELTMGWQRGDMIIIAARPSIGKTTFALNTAVASMASRRESVAFFSFEMRRLQLEYRILSSLSGVPLTRILSGYVWDQDWGKLTAALGTLDNLPIYVTDGASQTAIALRMACRRLKSETDLGLVVVDYVQLMPGSLERKQPTRTEELSDISRRLKELAVELDVPVLVLSQLSRAGEGETRKPRLSDLRECGALEQDADIVLFLHRKNHREGGLTECILEKQRNGPTGVVNLSLDRDVTTFRDGPAEADLPEKTEEERKDDRRRHFRRRNG